MNPALLLKKRWSCVPCVALICILSSAISALAAGPEPLADYKEAVVHLRGDFGLLIFPDDEMSGVDIENLETRALEEARDFVSKFTSVEFEGVDVEVDNSWLSEKLDEYASGSTSYDQRIQIFTVIYERLGAIEGKLAELEERSTNGPSKDENKRKLSEILNREEYRGPAADSEPSIAERVLRWLEEWFRSLFPPSETAIPELRSTGPGTFGYVLQILLYVFVAVIVGFLLYRFAPAIIRRARSKKKEKKEDRVVLGETIGAGRTTAELMSEAEALARDGRLREALRKGYVALLFGLGEKRLIGLAKHKTNRDYLRDLKGDDRIHRVVSGLTVKYERHWYGLEDAAEEDWLEFRTGFAEAVGSKKG